MKTIAAIKLVLDAFTEQIRNINAESEEGYRSALSDSTSKIIDALKQLRSIDPIMVPIVTMDESTFSLEESTPLFHKIIECSKQRKQLDMVFTGACAAQVIQRYRFAIPKYVNFEEMPHVLIQPYQDQVWEDFATRMMNQIVLGCLLSLPLGKVRINFVNPSLSNKAGLFAGNVSQEICRSIIDKKEIEVFVDSLTNRLKNFLKSGIKEIEGQPDNEIVVLLDYPYMFDNITEKMRLLVEQGGQTGIHFIVLKDLRRSFENKDSYDILSNGQLFAEFGAFDNAKKEDYDTKLTSTYELPSQPELLKLCLDYLKADVFENKDTQHIERSEEYIVAEDGLTVAIGTPTDNKTMNFCLGYDGHVHSFIIGQTGTGKSVLLHDIIIEAIHKYSPEDLQLYFLDCKLGGVEFNQYKDVKHARALLVDNSDILVILEILRDLAEQMYDRGKALRDAGLQKIDDYNQVHPNARMSRIWILIDECHVLFEQHSMNERKARSEIIDILTKVATEGRSQGVHLIMATQTLANADIPTSILNNITDRYILNCAPIDAEKMWSNSSRQTGKLGVGDVLYHNTTGKYPDTQFHAFYYSKDGIQKQIESAVDKAANHQSNGQFYFNGSQVFHFDKEVFDTVANIRKENLKACIGRSVGLKQSPIVITLKQDMSENVLLTGIDEKGQSMRTAMDLLFSLVGSNFGAGLNYKFYVFDFKDDDEGEYQDILEQLEQSGTITMVRKRQLPVLLKQLVDEIKSGNAVPTMLVILGQQRFSELKMDVELEEKPQVTDSFGTMSFAPVSGKEVKTYKDALNYILDNGPEQHVHTMLQVDKPDNLLFEDIITSKMIFRKFRHLVMLRSDEKAALKLGIPDEIRLENLNSEPERLRAVYYADGDDGWTLFSPFAMPNETELLNLTNK